MKRFISLLLALGLLLSLAPLALAAPTREIQRSEITVDLDLESLLDLVLGAAVMRGVHALDENQAPDPALVEGVLSLGLYSQYLPYHGADLWENRAALTHDEISGYYSQVFSHGSYAAPASVSGEGVTLTAQGMSFDLSSLQNNPVIGTHVYSTAFDGTHVTLYCDLFAYFGDFGQAPEFLPEDALTWLCNAQVMLEYSPDEAQHYTVCAFSLSDAYLDGMIHEWQAVENTEYEYSVALPAIFGLAENAPACMVWQTADGEATLTIQAQENMAGDYDAVLSNFLQDSVMQLTENRELSYFSAVFSAVDTAYYELHLVPEGINWHYTLTLQFPPERLAEFTLYAEFICNSLTAWGAANG